MAINSNHLFEELDGVKCAIVEKNADESRVQFLKALLELNRFEVKVIDSPPPKVVVPDAPAAPKTFTIGVTDVSFNPTNAIFGRLLHTADGHVVTLAYWQQKENISDDSTPYFQSHQ